LDVLRSRFDQALAGFGDVVEAQFQMIRGEALKPRGLRRRRDQGENIARAADAGDGLYVM